MKNVVSYEAAVKSMKDLIQANIVDGLVASTILTILFDKEKEDTLKDLIKSA